MYNNSNVYEIIEQFLAGELSEKDKALFEEKLREDDSLKQKVQIVKSAGNLLLQNKLSGLKSIMAEEQLKAEKPSSQNIIKYGVIILSVMITGGTVFWMAGNNQPEEKSLKFEKEIIQSNSGEKTDSVQFIEIEKSRGIENEEVKEPVNKIYSNREKKSVPVPDGLTGDKPTMESEGHKDADVVIQTHNPDKPVDIPAVVPTERKVQTQEKAPDDLCRNVKISAEIVTEEPCRGTSGGVIELKAIHGGRTPYKSSINNKESGSDSQFNNLNAGTYHIELTDANGCKHLFNAVTLHGKDCVTAYDFNPDRGEQWEGPVVKTSKLSILDKTGNLVYSKQMHDGEQCTWNGYSQSGTLLYGYFVFVVENKDGSVLKGTITITR
jgi:hypothetical protein